MSGRRTTAADNRALEVGKWNKIIKFKFISVCRLRVKRNRIKGSTRKTSLRVAWTFQPTSGHPSTINPIKRNTPTKTNNNDPTNSKSLVRNNIFIRKSRLKRWIRRWKVVGRPLVCHHLKVFCHKSHLSSSQLNVLKCMKMLDFPSCLFSFLFNNKNEWKKAGKFVSRPRESFYDPLVHGESKYRLRPPPPLRSPE